MYIIDYLSGLGLATLTDENIDVLHSLYAQKETLRPLYQSLIADIRDVSPREADVLRKIDREYDALRSKSFSSPLSDSDSEKMCQIRIQVANRLTSNICSIIADLGKGEKYFPDVMVEGIETYPFDRKQD